MAPIDSRGCPARGVSISDNTTSGALEAPRELLVEVLKTEPVYRETSSLATGKVPDGQRPGQLLSVSSLTRAWNVALRVVPVPVNLRGMLNEQL